MKLLHLLVWGLAGCLFWSAAISGGEDSGRTGVTRITPATITLVEQTAKASDVTESESELPAADTSDQAEADDAPQSRHPEAVAANDSGVVLLARGDVAAAAAAFRSALLIDSTYARAWYNLGLLQQRKQQFGDAIASYQRALAIRPNYYKPQYNLANLYLSISATDKAIAAFTRATEIRRSSASAPAHFNLAIAYTRDKRPQDAIKSYREALRLRPGYREARFNLALLLLQADSFAQAAEELERAAALGLQKARLFERLGLCRSKLEQYALAVGAYRKAIALDPSDPHTHYNLALAANRIDSTAVAIDAYQQAIRLDSRYHEAHHNLALLFERSGTTDSALVHYRASVQSKPTYSRGWYHLGELHAALKQHDSAIASFRRVVELDPANNRALMQLALAYSRSERPNEAAEAYRRLLDTDPLNTTALFNLGTVSLRIQQHDTAVVYLTRLIGLAPTPEALFNRAKALDELGRLDEAGNDLSNAIRIDSTYTRAYINLAILQERAGKLPEAVRLLTQARDLENDNWKTHWNLGQLYMKLNLQTEARASYQQAAAFKPASARFQREYQQLFNQTP